MQHIETVTVGSGGAASITFSAIPDTYTDLYVVASLRTVEASVGTGLVVKYNGSSSSYSSRRLYGFQTSAPASDTALAQFFILGSNATANSFSNVGFYIPNYRSSVAKSASFDGVGDTNSSSVFIGIGSLLWSVTDPITSLTLSAESTANFAEFSSASLYGVLAGSDGIVAVS